MSIAAVERHYGVNDSMICYVKKNEDKIWGSIKTCAPLSAEIKTRSVEVLKPVLLWVHKWTQDQGKR
jgi:hypothetical protein